MVDDLAIIGDGGDVSLGRRKGYGAYLTSLYTLFEVGGELRFFRNSRFGAPRSIADVDDTIGIDLIRRQRIGSFIGMVVIFEGEVEVIGVENWNEVTSNSATVAISIRPDIWVCRDMVDGDSMENVFVFGEFLGKPTRLFSTYGIGVP